MSLKVLQCLLQQVVRKKISILFVILVIGLVVRWGMLLLNKLSGWEPTLFWSSAPTSLPVPSGVEFVPVDSALSMQHAVESRYGDELDVVIMAAVSDF